MSDLNSPTKDEIKLLIDNALLQNNVIITAVIEKQSDKTAKAMTDQMTAANAQVISLAEKIGTVSEKQRVTDDKVKNMWAKMIGIGAGCTTLGGLVVLLITQLAGK